MSGASTRPALPDAGSCEKVEMSNRNEDPRRDRVVKQCPCCGYAWRTVEALLGDPQLQIVGYQANFADLLLGLFLFNHLGCGSTIAVPAELFKDLYNGPVYSARATGTAECPEYCLYVSELGACPAKCECAYVREILQIVRGWPKVEGNSKCSKTC
jgi:hypothetical protein